MNPLTRRQFLRIAGGVTFLALAPAGDGLFAADPDAALPLFIVTPYIQPGPGGALEDGKDTLVVAWQTEYAPADFEVHFGTDKSYKLTAQVVKSERSIDADVSVRKKPISPEAAQEIADTAVVEKRLNYYAVLTVLNLGRKCYYQVSGNGRVIAEGYASTRKPRGKSTRFVAFGDNSFGDVSDRAIAYLAYQSHPDFIMNTGDNVYESGLDNEYARYFFPAYNSDVAGPRSGAPLLRSVPFYTVIANHDVRGRDPQGRSAADFLEDRDSLGYYTAMHLPLNGPASPASPTPVVGSDEVLSQFRDCAAARFPRMANYSYDYADAHFLCLDSNDYIDPTDPSLQSWIESDLSESNAPWNFVVYHHPAFNVGEEHYREQQMRVLSPIFEKHGVDIVFSGHEHTYQRTMPLKFSPTDTSRATDTTSSNRLIPGNFTLDQNFDGEKNTRPNGIIYITTGAGGKQLYEPDFTDNPSRWLHKEDNNVAYIAKFYSRYHSLTVVDIQAKSLWLTQINEFGTPIDHIRIDKA